MRREQFLFNVAEYLQVSVGTMVEEAIATAAILGRDIRRDLRVQNIPSGVLIYSHVDGVEEIFEISVSKRGENVREASPAAGGSQHKENGHG